MDGRFWQGSMHTALRCAVGAATRVAQPRHARACEQHTAPLVAWPCICWSGWRVCLLDLICAGSDVIFTPGPGCLHGSDHASQHVHGASAATSQACLWWHLVSCCGHRDEAASTCLHGGLRGHSLAAWGGGGGGGGGGGHTHVACCAAGHHARWLPQLLILSLRYMP